MKKIVIVLKRLFYCKVLYYLNENKYKTIYPNYLRSIGIKISDEYRLNGEGYIAPTAYFDGTDYSLITIGHSTTISMNVVFLTHDYSICRGLQLLNKSTNYKLVKPISVGNNCFIGANSFLCPGVSIGDNCIVGGGSVVRGVIPPKSIVYGNPAEVHGNIMDFTERHLSKNDIVEI